MNLLKLTLRELLHRRVNFLLSALSVLLASAVLSGSLLLLNAYDLRTGAILSAKQAELEKQIRRLHADTVRAMETLGFNITILPANQNLADWYADDYAAQTMPESYVRILEKSGLLTIENLVPVLRQKVRWPETQWAVMIAGTGGAAAPPAGQVDIGAEIARGLSLKTGDILRLADRAYTVRNVMLQEATADDITLILPLAAAQELLGKEAQVSEIRALQCRAAWRDVQRIREEVGRILPGTQVIEKGSDVLTKVTAIRQVEEKGAAQIENERTARERMRRSVQRTLSLLLPFILLACTAWIYLLTADNTARRTAEIGTLRSLGFSSGAVAAVFLLRAALLGLTGGTAGLLISAAAARGMPFKLFILLLPFALLIALAGSFRPVWRAVNHDPADILRGEP
jgi:ABC-type lipoprotein release transport system permease subunit